MNFVWNRAQKAANPTNVVVSRYNKNTDFTRKFDGRTTRVMVYDHGNSSNPYNVPVNRGREASAFLKHIVDHYETLTIFTYFIHDEEFAWHHSGSVVQRVGEALASNRLYYNINDKCTNTIGDVKKSLIKNDWTKDFMSWYSTYIEPYSVPFDELDPDRVYRHSAQFLVHRDVIRSLPKAFYEDLYQWTITSEITDMAIGVYVEWIWPIVWRTGC